MMSVRCSKLARAGDDAITGIKAAFFMRESCRRAEKKREMYSSQRKRKEMWMVTHQTHTSAVERQKPVWYRGASAPILPQNCSWKARES